MTAINSNAIDVSHIQTDMKRVFMISKATVTQSRIAAIVLICKPTTSFKDSSYCSFCIFEGFMFFQSSHGVWVGLLSVFWTCETVFGVFSAALVPAKALLIPALSFGVIREAAIFLVVVLMRLFMNLLG